MKIPKFCRGASLLLTLSMLLSLLTACTDGSVSDGQTPPRKRG